jgi:hypothetical protein
MVGSWAAMLVAEKAVTLDQRKAALKADKMAGNLVTPRAA